MLKPGDREAILADVTAQLVEFTSLIGDLVQLARDDETGRLEVLDFRDVVNSALDRARRRGHGLVFDVELDPFYVVGQSDPLERAVTNLLDNAVKWSPPGGTVRVQLEGDRLRVADQGPGIATADLPARVRPLLPGRHRPEHTRHRPRAVHRGPDHHPARWLGQSRPLRPGRGGVHRPAARRDQPGQPAASRGRSVGQTSRSP